MVPIQFAVGLFATMLFCRVAVAPLLIKMPTALFPLIVPLLTVSVRKSLMPHPFPVMVLLLIVNVLPAMPDPVFPMMLLLLTVSMLPWMPRGRLLLIVLSLIVAEPLYWKIPPSKLRWLCEVHSSETAVFPVMVLLLIVNVPLDQMAPPVALLKVPTR